MLSKLVRAAHVIQTLENYALIENSVAPGHTNDPGSHMRQICDEEDFWGNVLNSDGSWGFKFTFRNFVFNEWIPRIPGLYWAQGSQVIRSFSQNEVPIRKGDWIEFSPPGKSAKVLGGIGSMLLPANEHDMVLCSISAFGNASTGIPVLIAQELVDHYKLTTGSVIDLNAVWRPMPGNWTFRFSSMKAIPKGVLVIDSPSQVSKKNNEAPFQFHPYSIMEYESGGGLFWDFVYVTGEHSQERARLEDFFEYYRTKDGRHGKYLLGSEVNKPLFNAEFNSPSDLKTPYGNAQLHLIEQRIKNQNFNQNSLDALVRKLSNTYSDSAEFRSFMNRLGINTAFFSGTSSAQLAPQLVSRCLIENRIEELVYRLCTENPGMFT